MSVITKLSVQDYLEQERSSNVRYEYEQGEVREMPGGTKEHSGMSRNILAHLYFQLGEGSCEVYNSDLRVLIAATGLYTYPDVSVVCGEAQFEDGQQDSLLNPTVLFDVLSKSTESYDRGKKFQHYQMIPSLSDYVLVAQDAYRVEHLLRKQDGWLLQSYIGLAAKVTLSSIGCTLALADVYKKISIEPKLIP
jgi:Uma2 family endonuclease